MAKDFEYKRFQVQRYGVGDLDTDWQFADESPTLEGAWKKARALLTKLQKKADKGTLSWDEYLHVRVIEIHGEIEGDYTLYKEVKSGQKI